METFKIKHLLPDDTIIIATTEIYPAIFLNDLLTNLLEFDKVESFRNSACPK